MRKMLINFYTYNEYYSEMEGAKFTSREYKRIYETIMDGVKYYLCENYKNYTKSEFDNPNEQDVERETPVIFPNANFYFTNDTDSTDINKLLEKLTDGNPYVIVEDNRDSVSSEQAA